MGRKVLKLAVALATMALPLVALPVVASAAAGPAATALSAGQPGPSDVVTWVNNLRTSVNAAPLTTNAGLTSVAQTWANNMAATQSLTHNPKLSTQAPSGWTKMGENVGTGYSLSAVYNALVASPDHYANMVDKAYNRTGVGVATDARGQVWLAEDFGDYPPPVPSTFVFPTNGDRIFSSAQAFSWLMTPGAGNYDLTVGSSQGAYDLLNTGLLPNNQLSYTVAALPGGHTLWARIYTYAQGIWTWSDASFSVVGASTATFTRPTMGATNVSISQALTWSPVSNAAYYLMTIGTSLGAYDLVNSGVLSSTQTSYRVTAALPMGTTLWARIYSFIGGSWSHYQDVSFTAAP